MTLHVILSLLGYFLFSAAAGAMSPPHEDQKDKFYGWFYRFLQILAANAARLAEARFGTIAIPGTIATLASSTSESATLTVAHSDPTAK